MRTYPLLYTTEEFFVWSLDNLHPARVPVKHLFHPLEPEPVHKRSRRLSPGYHDIVRKVLDGILETGIVPLASSGRSFPVIIGQKKHGTLGFCVDYRGNNQATTPGQWVLLNVLNVQEILQDLERSSNFTTPEFLSGYWEVQMSRNCKKVPGFGSRYRALQCENMPFGLMKARSTLQQMIGKVFSLYLVAVYLYKVVLVPKQMESVSTTSYSYCR